MNDENLNNYLPSVINPKTVRKEHDFSLTQNSVISRCSLSLKRNRGLSKNKSNLNFPLTKKVIRPQNKNESSTQNDFTCNSVPKQSRDSNLIFKELNKENYNIFQKATSNKNKSVLINDTDIENASTLNLSCEDLTIAHDAAALKTSYFDVFNWNIENNAVNLLADNIKKTNQNNFSIYKDVPAANTDNLEIINVESHNKSHVTISSATSFNKLDVLDETQLYDVPDQSHISISFGVKNCDSINLTSKHINIKNILVSHKNNDISIDCEIIQSSPLSFESEFDENMNETSSHAQKRSGVAVNLEIKKKKPSSHTSENKVLILKSDAVNKLSHVIVQPQNCKIVKRHLDKNKFQRGNNIKCGAGGGNLKQISIDGFISRSHREDDIEDLVQDVDMRKGVDAVRCDRAGKGGRENESSLSARAAPGQCAGPGPGSGAAAGPRAASSGAPRRKSDSVSSQSPRKLVDAKQRSNRMSGSLRNIPHYKIVAGTHFAVDAFSYGDIPNVKHYFLTHFHSDHYSGLKKGFNKMLFCSKITGDLCVSRLGVNAKCIHVLNADETVRIDGVEVTAVDANHCPGAVMLIFTLPNGKTILHTGDFRATPVMESYPMFWNKDIHTIYLDTTYCNPRYDFPSQEQSLELALALLRQKKMALEKAGRKFSSVLIVCGTYTIGKEKFFLGMSRRVGCRVWACPEKARVLAAVQAAAAAGGCCSQAAAVGGPAAGGQAAGGEEGCTGLGGAEAPRACQLHVVPMRDLTHEKLKSYLESLEGAFSEVVAFKPSGWENGKNTTVEKDMVTIHGIPYSEHSSFSELVRFVKYLKPKQVVPTVDISGGIKAVQKYFPCPLLYKEEAASQSRVTDYFAPRLRPPSDNTA